VFDIGMNRAMEELAKKIAARNPSREPIKDLGEHPEHKGTVLVMNGRYGPYIKWGKINATIPKDIEPNDVTLESAIKLIDDKISKKPKTKRKARKKPKTKIEKKAK
jgi:DNA topoisomerase-1